MNARTRFDEAFDNLCVAQGEYAAVTGGTWADIAKYKPGYMDDHVAHRKKKDAVFIARDAFDLDEARAAETRALLWNLQVTREVEEATEWIRVALEQAADVVRAEQAEAHARAERAAIANAAAEEAAAKEVEEILAREKAE